MNRVITSLFLVLICISTSGQTGGDNTYEFLSLSPNSLISSLGGVNVSIWGDDPAYYSMNPALLNDASTDQLALNYVNYIAGVNYGSVSYAMKFNLPGVFSGGINYLNYGKFREADPSGNITGEFRASEYALKIGWSYCIDTLFSAGINIKPVISQLERYISFGMAFDVGASWHSRDGLLSAGLAIRNSGLQIITYTGVREKLPTEISAGITGKLKHAPLRFSLTLNNLQKYKLLHEYKQDEQPPTGSALPDLAENLLRHIIIGAELLPTRNFYIAAGFNYKRRREMLIDSRSSTVGFSMGAGIKTSSFSLAFSRSKYHLAASTNNFSLVIVPGSLLKIK